MYMSAPIVKRSDILVDQRLIAINLDELNLLQSCILLPKPVNILALKKRFAIKLSKQDLIQDIQDKTSPIHKLTQAMIISQIERIILAEKESVRVILQNIEKKQKEQVIALLEEEELEQEAIKNYLASSGKPAPLGMNLPPDILIKSADAQRLQYFLLEASKYRDLEYYLHFAKDENTIETIREIIDQRYTLIRRNMEALDRMAAVVTTDEQQEMLNELNEINMRHLALSSHENMETHVFKNRPDIVLDDPVMLKQHLRGMVVQEDIIYTMIESELISIGESEKYSVDKYAKTSEKEYVGHATQQIIPNTSDVKSVSNYRNFQNMLNDKLSNFLATNEIITSGFTEFKELLNKLHTLIHENNNNATSLRNVDSEVVNLKNILESQYNGELEEIIECLNWWCEKNEIKDKKIISNQESSSKEIYTIPLKDKETEDALIRNLKLIVESEDVNGEQKKLLSNLLESLKENSSDEEIIENFNLLVEAHSNLECIPMIYSYLTELSFLNTKNLLKPDVNFDLQF